MLLTKSSILLLSPNMVNSVVVARRRKSYV